MNKQTVEHPYIMEYSVICSDFVHCLLHFCFHLLPRILISNYSSHSTLLLFQQCNAVLYLRIQCKIHSFIHFFNSCNLVCLPGPSSQFLIFCVCIFFFVLSDHSRLLNNQFFQGFKHLVCGPVSIQEISMENSSQFKLVISELSSSIP